jgi:hypothetical protein
VKSLVVARVPADRIPELEKAIISRFRSYPAFIRLFLVKLGFSMKPLEWLGEETA